MWGLEASLDVLFLFESGIAQWMQSDLFIYFFPGILSHIVGVQCRIPRRSCGLQWFFLVTLFVTSCRFSFLCEGADFFFKSPFFSCSPIPKILLSPVSVPYIVCLFLPLLHQLLERSVPRRASWQRCSSLSVGSAHTDQSVSGGVCWLNDIKSLTAPFRIYCKSLPLNGNMVVVSPTPLPSWAWILAAWSMDSSRACNIIRVQLEEASLSFSLLFFFLTCSTRI